MTPCEERSRPFAPGKWGQAAFLGRVSGDGYCRGVPRIPRAATGSLVLHLLNRGNARAVVFREASEYRDFIGLLWKAKEAFGVAVLAYCLMPNHFHLVARPPDVPALSAFMQWWMTAHVRRHHRRQQGSGHVWQGRYKSFPIQEDVHLMAVLRYVLLNPVRAGLVARAGDWPFSSLQEASRVDAWPVRPTAPLDAWLALGDDAAEGLAIRRSISRRAPYGDPAWSAQVAAQTGLEATLRPRGRPRRGVAAPGWEAATGATLLRPGACAQDARACEK
uniref:Transposase IS200-like domain-containing protein n=1 Tax=Simulacricoccus ruber TaxID=2303410 RepID=A0A3Q8I578_9BACT|nr:hypothetical protein [Simulacricoccus ruber]